MALKSTWRKVEELEAGKQDNLVSGTNIKTINGSSILGSGNLVVSGGGGISDGDKGDIMVSGSGSVWTIDNNAVTNSKINDVDATKVTEDATHRFATDTEKATWNAKQDALISGTNIKSIEGQSLLGSGNIDLSKSDVGLSNVDNTSDLDKPISILTQTALNTKQDTLISATNIKTVNGSSLLGSGNLTINNSPSLGLVTGTNVTGVTAMTKSATITLPANTISTVSILEIEARAIRVATLTGSIAFQMYINTSDSLTGATLLGVFNSMTTSNWFTQARRSLFINPTINTLICVNTGTTVATDFTSTGANGSVTFDETQTYYLIFAVQPSSTATTATVQYAFAKRYV